MNINITLTKFKSELLRTTGLLVFFIAVQANAQISNYVFSQSHSSYSPLVSATTIVRATDEGLRNTSFALSLPFGFTFNDLLYSQLHVHSSGFVSFGANAPMGNTPISNNATSFEGAIAALAAPLTARFSDTGEEGKISYQVQGIQPNRVLVIQWENFGYFTSETQPTSNTFNLNFQIQLSEDGTIKTVYDLNAVGSPTNFASQIGLRGASATDFNNRYAIGITARNNLANSSLGTSNNATVDIYPAFLPPSGFTMTWTPSNFCLPLFEYGASSEMITQVVFNSIDNPSPFQSGTTPVYEDFRAISTTVHRENTYAITVKGPAGSFSSDVMVYIDFNQNGRYDDTGEGFYLGKIEPGNPANAKTVSGNITIPLSALSGSTTMRIIKNSGLTSTNSITAPCATNLRAGQVEDYTVNIPETDTSAECNQTEPGLNPGDTGCITLRYQGVNVTYSTVRAQDGNIWIQQNLGSPAVASSATDSANYGDLFQWGRWDDGHQLRTSAVQSTVISPNNPLGLEGGLPFFLNSQPRWWESTTAAISWDAPNPQAATAANGCDPCKALGVNWGVPTEEQWNTVITAENIVNIQTAFDSNLKLTVAGFRGGSNTIESQGVRGYYWSKTPSATNSSFQKYLYYSNITMNTGAGAFRSQGSSVRCVKLSTAVDPVFPAPYCGTQAVTTSTLSEITEVSLGGIVKSSAIGLPNTPLIEDFTATVFELEKEVAHPIKIIGGTHGQTTVSVYAYIDWNHNNVFDAEEVINLGYLTNVAQQGNQEMGELISTLTIPSTAMLGQTRLRLVKAYESSSSMGTLVNLPCPTGWFIGQIEDYTVNIKAAPAIPNAEQLQISVANNLEPLINTQEGTLQLVSQIRPLNANQEVIWSVLSGETIVSINARGLVSALASGAAVVRATAVSDSAVFADLTIIVTLPPVCMQPIAVNVNSISAQAVSFSWQVPDGEATFQSFQYELRSHGAIGAPMGLVQRGETNHLNAIVSGLLPNTHYAIYVRTLCDENSLSNWTTTVEFTTDCDVLPAPMTQNQNFCGNKSIADLVVTGVENAAFNWYESSTATVVLNRNSRLVSRTYYVSQKLGGCESTRTAVEVVVSAGIPLPQVTNQSFCFTDVTVADLEAVGDIDGEISWYENLQSTTPLAQTFRLTTAYYYVSQKIGDCESERKLINITVATNITAPVVTAQRFCGIAAVADLRAQVNPGMQVRWYRVNEGDVFLAPTVALTTGTYYVAQALGDCESPRTAVLVHIDDIPEPPTGERFQEVLSGATLATIEISAFNPIWYNSQTDAQSDRNRISSDTAVIPDMTYYVVNQSIEGCQSQALAITITTTLKRGEFDQANFRYYPNPTTTSVFIDYIENMTSFSVFDSNGKLMTKQTANANQLEVDLKTYAPGIYLICLTTQNQQQYIRVVKK